jgi:hypothetical protein
MQENLEGLRALCNKDLAELSPFQVRTRFERYLYGLLSECMTEAFGSSPQGLSKAHLNDFRKNLLSGTRSPGLSVLDMVGALFEKFTILCDTSNWSDDGQDPRINFCRNDILELCDYVPAHFTKRSPAHASTRR